MGVSLVVANHHGPVFLDLLVKVDDCRGDVGVVACTHARAHTHHTGFALALAAKATHTLCLQHACVRTVDMGSKCCVSQVRPCTEACRVDHRLTDPLGNNLLELAGDLVLEVAAQLYDPCVEDVVGVSADDSRATIRRAKVLRYIANTVNTRAHPTSI